VNPWVLEGSATLGAILRDQSGQDTSKINEYQDLNSGALSNILLRGRNDKTWIDAYGENFGRDDMYISVRGGLYDLFKYPHLLELAAAQHGVRRAHPLQWNRNEPADRDVSIPQRKHLNQFDLGYERKDTGGYFEWQGTSPWYFRVDANHLTFDGTKSGRLRLARALATGSRTSHSRCRTRPTAPRPRSATTRARCSFSASYLYSRFNNDNTVLQWTIRSSVNQLDSTYLPLDNNYQRIALNGVLRDLGYVRPCPPGTRGSKTNNDTVVPLFALNSGGASRRRCPTPITSTGSSSIRRSLWR
jgi:hypothetical protein